MKKLLLSLLIGLTVSNFVKADTYQSDYNLKRVLLASKLTIAQNYYVSDLYWNGTLNQSQDGYFNTLLTNGTNYIFLIVGDGNVDDLDVKIYDSVGNVVCSDSDSDSTAVCFVNSDDILGVESFKVVPKLYRTIDGNPASYSVGVFYN